MFWRFSSSPIEEVGTEPPVEYPQATQPIDNAKYIPLRLTMQERKTQRLMRGIIQASSYTDKVDNESLAPPKRIAVIGREIGNALSGFIAALDIGAGCQFMREKQFGPFQTVIVEAIEYCRRYKIMNPDLLRTDYVKFLYLLQDAVRHDVIATLGFNPVSPVLTVQDYLKNLGADQLLSDSRLGICITPVPKIDSRSKLNKALRFKDVSVTRVSKDVAAKATGANVTAENIEIAIRSLNDANCFSNDNADSADKMMKLLQKYFSNCQPNSPTFDLTITEGLDGSRLTHEHTTQYNFVMQSLALWKNISSNMFRLWIIAENDLLNPEVPYEFRFTGQGFQRVQPAPNLYRELSAILENTKRELGQWVGSEKIHLGDNQVPNAFHFIDKYGQISRILIPILRTIDKIDELEQSVTKRQYMSEVWGNGDGARRSILADFFRHGFDGSGGDNMDDAGSCIDGRLTSAWNWCNTIRSKPFYPLFLMAGFCSFDGDLTL